MWEPSTIQLNKVDVTLFQSLASSRQRRACLILYSGAEIGRRWSLDGEHLQIGRMPDCEIAIDSPGISRRHAELRMAGNNFVLSDLGSANGSYLNDRRVEAPERVKDGDFVRVGNVVLRFYERESLDALLHDRIYRMATVDAGTGVYTKKYLFEALEREIRLARASERSLSLVCLDLDHFKTVNDEHGHNAGDQVLRDSAAAVQASVRATDIVGRIGGEEFAVILPDTELLAAALLAERIRAAVAGREHALSSAAGTVRLRQTVSLGVACLDATMATARDLLGAADVRLYTAKRSGRDRVES